MPDSNRISVTQAAKTLGISRQRVLQLVHKGALPAVKVGSTWALDADAVAERAKLDARAGRPARANTRTPQKRRYTLMNAEYEVLALEYDHANHHFSASHDILDAARAPIGVISPRGTHEAGAAASSGGSPNSASNSPTSFPSRASASRSRTSTGCAPRAQRTCAGGT